MIDCTQTICPVTSHIYEKCDDRSFLVPSQLLLLICAQIMPSSLPKYFFISIISLVQSGFRSERSIDDNLVGVKAFIRDAFDKKGAFCRCIFRLGKSLRYHSDISE